MLCELVDEHAHNPLVTWFLMTILASFFILLSSGAVFIDSYVYARFERWQQKTNPVYPSVHDVRKEIITSGKGLFTGAIPPLLSLYLAKNGIGYAYCGIQNDAFAVTKDSFSGSMYLVFTFLIAWIGSDFYEFYYHRWGHTNKAFWNVHKHHHAFYNPTPFSVIADEPIDQFMRALPMLFFPLLMPMNMDMLFVTYGIFFYTYGVYLHWGHEFSSESSYLPSAHNQWMNTSFQHYIHHAKSVVYKPYHTGFFLKIWDNLFDSLWDKSNFSKKNDNNALNDCICANCCRKRGERSREAWEKVVVPNYEDLWNWKFWLIGPNYKSLKSI